MEEIPVRIVTTHFNRVDFIEYQYASIKKFVHDKYEFIVINDALDRPDQKNFFNGNIRAEISNTCAKNGIKCVEFPDILHFNRKRINPKWCMTSSSVYSARVADTIQYGLNNFGFNHKGIYVILDGDMVFINHISFKDILKKYNANIIAVPQKRENYQYFWNGIVVLDIPNLPHISEIDFNCGVPPSYSVEGDTGALTTVYLNKYIKSLRWHMIEDQYISMGKTLIYSPSLPLNIVSVLQKLYEKYDNPEVISLGTTLLDDTIYHYVGGGNWTLYNSDNPIILYKNEILKSIL